MYGLRSYVKLLWKERAWAGMGDWDDAIKIYISDSAQELLEWIYGTRIVVKRKLQTEFKVRTIEADALLETEVIEFEAEEEAEPLLFHIEVQSTNDPQIPARLLRYSFSAREEHHLEVCSCVIYLRDVGPVPQPPLRWQRSNGKVTLVFDYTVVELAKIPLEDLKQTGRISLLPLLVLTQGGANRVIMQEVITELAEARKADLLFIAKLFADLVFTGEGDHQWLERIFAMYRDPLSQTPTYQKILEEGREEGLEKGREEGKLEGLQQAVLNVVEVRFPSLMELARERVPLVHKPGTIEYAFKALLTVPDEKTARMMLELLAA